MDSGPTSHSFVSQRLKLHYVDWGNAGAPPLLLVHGGRDHCRSWDWTARQLARDWHVIAPDLRGHGDSQWVPDGHYHIGGYVYDLAQLVHQLDLGPVTIVAHSLGANVSLRYAGLYPDMVRKLVAIEGIFPTLGELAQRSEKPLADHIRGWVAGKRAAAARMPKRYASLDEALARMKAENGYLNDEQARHLTIHGASRNEDGSWSWKFDNYLRIWPFTDIPMPEIETLWRAITCPVMLMVGKTSWLTDPRDDGRISNFRNPQVVAFDNAGHWLHHDQFDRFIAELKRFL